MNELKMNQLVSSLNGTARKVLDTVPILEAWDRDQIWHEMRRAGCNIDRGIVEGCLDNLRGKGLITEASRGAFIRVQPKPKQHQQEMKIVNSLLTPKPGPQAETKPAVDDFAEIVKLIERLNELAEEVTAVTEQLETHALALQSRIDTLGKDTEKLRQLQDLLKGLGQ